MFKSVYSYNNAQQLTFESYCLSSGEQKGRMFDKQIISKKYRRDETSFDIFGKLATAMHEFAIYHPRGFFEQKRQLKG